MTERPAIAAEPTAAVRGLRGLLRLLAPLPLPIHHALGTALGLAAWWLPTRMRRRSLQNLERCLPELDARQRRRLARRSLVETGKAAMEIACLWFSPDARIRRLVREIRGEEILHRALAAGRGVIALTPHLGSWEMVAQYYGLGPVPLTCLYRPPRQAPLEALLQSRRRGTLRLLPTTAAGVRGLYRALAEGGIAGILPDQDPGPGGGVFAPFFGHPARTMTLVSKLARRSGAPVIFSWVERLPRGRGYAIRFAPAPEGIASPDPYTAARALNQGVENCVRALPGQYQWSYNRFRAAPPPAATSRPASRPAPRSDSPPSWHA